VKPVIKAAARKLRTPRRLPKKPLPRRRALEAKQLSLNPNLTSPKLSARPMAGAERVIRCVNL